MRMDGEADPDGLCAPCRELDLEDPELAHPDATHGALQAALENARVGGLKPTTQEKVVPDDGGAGDPSRQARSDPDGNRIGLDDDGVVPYDRKAGSGHERPGPPQPEPGGELSARVREQSGDEALAGVGAAVEVHADVLGGRLHSPEEAHDRPVEHHVTAGRQRDDLAVGPCGSRRHEGDPYDAEHECAPHERESTERRGQKERIATPSARPFQARGWDARPDAPGPVADPREAGPQDEQRRQADQEPVGERERRRGGGDGEGRPGEREHSDAQPAEERLLDER